MPLKDKQGANPPLTLFVLAIIVKYCRICTALANFCAGLNRICRFASTTAQGKYRPKANHHQISQHFRHGFAFAPLTPLHRGRKSRVTRPAQVVELVDALASGASVRKDVEVQVLSWAPKQTPPASFPLTL